MMPREAVQNTDMELVRHNSRQLFGGRAEYHRLIESLRVMLAIISGLLMLDMRPEEQIPLAIVVLAFGSYAGLLLWVAADGSFNVQRRIFYWIDAVWFLMMLSLAGTARTHYFLFLYFPVVFAAWRTGFKESIAIAAFCSLASLVVFFLQQPSLPWRQVLVLPLSLFIVGPLLIALARTEAFAQKSLAFAAEATEDIDPRQAVDSVIPDLLAKMAKHIDAAAALLVVRTSEGDSRAYVWDANDGPFKLSENSVRPLVDQVLSLPADVSAAWSSSRHWWRLKRCIEMGPGGTSSPFLAADRQKLAALSSLVGHDRLMTVPLTCTAIGRARLLFAGESIQINHRFLEMLQFMLDQVSPSVENAWLRDRLASEAADTERAKIGRDLHDVAMQPYIGLKFALEALRRKAGPDNPVAGDLENLEKMVTEELASMREVISGMRGVPGKGGELLSSALRRQAARFSQLFGIQVEVEVEGEMPVNRRMAGELFHIVAEGLSNIRRHTQSRRAWISAGTSDGQLVVSIRNVSDPGSSSKPDFLPRSLSERALELGGFVEVKRDGANTNVIARVPLPVSRRKDSPHE